MPRKTGAHRGGRKCSVCTHEQVGRINFLLVVNAGELGRGQKAVAVKFGLGLSAICNHSKNHISVEYRRAVLAGPLRSEEDLRQIVAEEGVSVLQNFRGLFNAHRARWMVALESGSDELMIKHGRAMAEMLSRIGQLTREISPPTTLIQNNISVYEQPEYLRSIMALTRALKPFPEARRAAVAALRSLEPPQTIEAA